MYKDILRLAGLLPKNSTQKIEDICLTKHAHCYSPIILCLRGRYYYTSQIWLSGFSIERGLFLAPYDKEITGIGLEALINYFLCLYGSAVEGNEIKHAYSWKQKVTSFGNLCSYYSKPELRDTAKKPYLFTQCQRELIRLGLFNHVIEDISKLSKLKTNLLISLDMTSSGTQILATLVQKSKPLLEAVNLTKQTYTSLPGKYYLDVAEKCNVILLDKTNYSLLNEEERSLIQIYLKDYSFFDIKRVKTVVMSVPYSIITSPY